MTLVLLWKNSADIVVIADTLFSSGGRPGLEIGPKVFSVPIRFKTFEERSETHICSDMGFAFAGFTSAGQATHAIASAGLQNLAGPVGSACPSVEEVARYYSRCGTYVVDEMRRHFASDKYRFEGVVFGWQSDQAVAYTFELGINSDGNAASHLTHLDFNKHGLYAIGQGHERVQDFIDKSGSTGKQASPYDALLSVIADKTIPTVGGGIQAAVAGRKGVELKSVLLVDETGMAQGGFMGADMGRLGSVGDLTPINIEPVVLARTLKVGT